MHPLDIVFAVLMILAAMSVPVAMVMRRSRAKGRCRLAGSFLLGLAFISAFPSALRDAPHLWQALLLPLAGLILIWLGVRKYRRDPEGRTPPAEIL